MKTADAIADRKIAMQMAIRHKSDVRPVVTAMLVCGLGVLFTFGLLPAWFYLYAKPRTPKSLNEEGFSLRNGVFIPWEDLEHARMIRVIETRGSLSLVADRHLADQLELTWGTGCIRIDRHMFENGDEVMREFIRRIPASVWPGKKLRQGIG